MRRLGEIAGGYLANSLAIMTDAAHLCSDMAGLFISLFAVWMGRKPATSTHTFGFQRAEIAGATASVFLIWALTGILVYEAINRIINPVHAVDGKIMVCCVFARACVRART